MDTGYPALIPDLVPPVKETEPPTAKPDTHQGELPDASTVPNSTQIPLNPQNN